MEGLRNEFYETEIIGADEKFGAHNNVIPRVFLVMKQDFRRQHFDCDRGSFRIQFLGKFGRTCLPTASLARRRRIVWLSNLHWHVWGEDDCLKCSLRIYYFQDLY